MFLLICPDCGAENSLEAESCQECDASLAGVTASEIPNPQHEEEDEFDLLPQDEGDLPSLLHALKQDGEIGAVEEASQNGPLTSSEDLSNIFQPDDPEEEEVIPDWLNRIRQRASEETDSVGEITQKISAAQESLAEGKSGSQHDSFDSWIRNLRDQAEEQAIGKSSEEEGTSGENADAADKDLDWLSRVRKAQGKLLEEAGQGSSSVPGEGDSLLQWLVALEEGTETPSHDPEGITSEKTDPGEPSQKPGVLRSMDHDVTQQISTDDLEPMRTETPDLTISREEQIQADQLSAAIVDERASRPIRKPGRRSYSWVIRLIIGVLLITGLSLSLFVVGKTNLPQGNRQPHTAAILSWAEAQVSGESLLIVFDYSAGFGDELSLVAKPILETVIQANDEVTILSSSVSGSLFSQQLFGEIEGIDGLSMIDLGYFPVAALGAYEVSNRIPSTWQFIDLPKTSKVIPSDGYDGILILSDSYEGARSWVEQLSALTPQTPINLLVTAQAGPMLLPYWESGQVTGMVSGLSEAAEVETVLAKDNPVAIRWRAYQTGVFMLIALMMMGVIFGLERSANDEGQGTV